MYLVYLYVDLKLKPLEEMLMKRTLTMVAIATVVVLALFGLYRGANYCVNKHIEARSQYWEQKIDNGLLDGVRSMNKAMRDAEEKDAADPE